MTVYRPPRIIQHLNELMERHGWLRDDDLRNLALELGEPLHRVEGVAFNSGDYAFAITFTQLNAAAKG